MIKRNGYGSIDATATRDAALDSMLVFRDFHDFNENPLAGSWDVLLNEAELELSDAHVASGREVMEAMTWDPASRVTLGQWAWANGILVGKDRRLEPAIRAAESLSCEEYVLALDQAGIAAEKAIAMGTLPCSRELATEQPALAVFAMKLWRATSVHSSLFIGNALAANSLRMDGSEDPDITAKQKSSASTGGRSNSTRSRTPQETGAVLENGVVGVLGRLFDLSRDATGFSMLELRKQLSGTQFGTDVIIRARAAKVRSTCLLECKNYRRAVRLADISEKLLAAENYYDHEPVDHWILISPHSDPSNELDLQVQKWNANRRFPFQIQLWSPQNGVRRLLAVDPSAYSDVYGADALVPDVDSAEVVEDFTNRLRPVPRVPASVADYLDSPGNFLQPNEREWVSLLAHHISRRGLDSDGRPLALPLDEAILASLQPTPNGSTALLTADFGEGKSFFTVSFCNTLRERFLSDPAPANPIPFRFFLKDFRRLESATLFLQDQLERIGISRGDWTRLSQQWRVLVVLDGMDEMSVPQDPSTVRENFRKVDDLLRELSGVSVLVTTRPSFFISDRDRQKMLDRLRHPTEFQLAQPDRRETVNHLREFAGAHQLGPKLDRIKELYDPVGLAGKVLFLEMIKTTLPDLPEDRFDERILYETYVEQSFRRKPELLRDPSDSLTDDELFSQALQLLEKIAVAIHSRGEALVDLRDFLQDEGGAAQLLWRSAENPELNSDATVRVGGRSLLRRVRRSNHAETEDRWLVDFFHRSMKEYFVARAVVRALAHPRAFEATRALMRELPVQSEILTFFRLMVDELRDPVTVLSSVARSSRMDIDDTGTIGGSSISMYHAVGGNFSGESWRGLRLDGALLVGANLTQSDFRTSSLRGANLSSTDFRDSDLRGADLTDANLGMGERIIDLHHAGTDTRSGSFLGLTSKGGLVNLHVDRSGEVTFEEISVELGMLRARRVFALNESASLVVGDGQITVVEQGQKSATVAFQFRAASSMLEADLVGPDYIGLLHTDEYAGLSAALINLESCEPVWTVHLPTTSHDCRWGSQAVFFLSNDGFSSIRSDGETHRFELAIKGCTAVHVRQSPAEPADDGSVVLCGTSMGAVVNVRSQRSRVAGVDAELVSPIRALVGAGSLVLSASYDGTIGVWETREGVVQAVNSSERRLRCEGAQVSQMSGDRERMLFTSNGAIP
ncbi:pentapeptide repeat-containing protein [Aeromicrobium sp.]|uniref:NACHT domain-containing protein n=1 Tax=Aeromicrobium sp. TaxID=1871063 RepID=UPI0028A5C2A0|nr:pentapeptide repeat-containing protein [Aeromicrobium sp.]